ncbi:MAG: hypothetical protein DSM106950_32690 [Stigonema ocellatum SAG 48.90 = DSM 106950]|nr:hypothetical protein [Stigonema ocellatum SAG 48.90 = DSM 106950]
MKRTYTFGLLAAALIVMPTAAFAESSSQQELNQSATAIGYGSQVNQRANQRSIQYQNRAGYIYHGSGSQRSNQLINQNGVAIDGSRVDQNANQVNMQHQNSSRRY